jgi:hypothetical protein
VISPGLLNKFCGLRAALLSRAQSSYLLRLIINLPPRHLKSHLASIAFPAWCLGHDPRMRILCVSHAQGLTDNCRATTAASR